MEVLYMMTTLIYCYTSYYVCSLNTHTLTKRETHLLRVSGIAELSRADSEMDDDWERDDVWVKLFPIQLVYPHRAGFLLHTHDDNTI